MVWIIPLATLNRFKLWELPRRAGEACELEVVGVGGSCDLDDRLVYAPLWSEYVKTLNWNCFHYIPK